MTMPIKQPTRWKRDLALLSGLIAATIVPMGIHIVMFDDLGIPDPTSYPKNGWPALPDRIMMMGAVLYLAYTVRMLGRPHRPVLEVLRVFLCVGAINQDLVREAIMRNSVSTKWTIYPFIDNLPVVFPIAATSGLAVILAPALRRRWNWPLAAAALALAYEAMAWIANRLFRGVLAITEPLEGDTRYFPPYDWHVNLPSYLTYAEAVLGACGVAAILARQSGSRGRKLLITAVMIFLIGDGPLFKPFLNILFGTHGPMVSILSYAQFTFETLALALIVSLLWFGLAPRIEEDLEAKTSS